MRSALDVNQPVSRLHPLTYGEPVTLSVLDPRIAYKKRIGYPVILHIMPVGTNEEDQKCFMFSMPGYGCEIMCSGSFKVSPLLHMGLPVSTAKLLLAELNKLFQ